MTLDSCQKEHRKTQPVISKKMSTHGVRHFTYLSQREQRYRFGKKGKRKTFGIGRRHRRERETEREGEGERDRGKDHRKESQRRIGNDLQNRRSNDWKRNSGDTSIKNY